MSTILHAGIDVSARILVVCIEGLRKTLEFPNTPAGHRAVIRRLSRRNRTVRVVLEASGFYSLDATVALDDAPGIEVMVLNPRVAHHFAQALAQRSKTDPADAEALLDYAQRMDFVPWVPPPKETFQLRALMRRRASLVKISTAEKNRLHASSATREVNALVRKDIRLSIRQMDKRITRIVKQATDIVARHAGLRRKFKRLISTKGIATVSGLHILAEVAVLPEGLTAKQWTAQAGLDPRHHTSGDSVHKPPRISKAGSSHLRASLYMPALVAIQHQPTVNAFHAKLLARGKTPMQANVAVMRKLLVAIHAILENDVDYDPKRFYEMPKAA